MSGETVPREEASAASGVMVRIEPNRRGGWTVARPAPLVALRCETLDDAHRLAYLSVADTLPCELIVRDAYHRVLRHELIDARLEDAPNGGGRY